MTHMTLKDYRQWKKLSTHNLADRIGISQPYLSQIETGAKPCSRRAAMMIRAATAGHVGYDDLFGELKEKPTEQ
jgi:DNA-binding transcriptional regulator YdaS (Cro superfamily)